MKKVLIFISLLTLAFAFSSCTKKEPDIKAKKNLVTSSQDSIDIDLSQMNYNMISSITFEMLIDPEKYADKSVKISGKFYTTIHEGQKHYAVFLWDPTGCCPAGLSFIPSESIKEEADALTMDDQVTVTGKLKYDPSNTEKEISFIAEKIIRP